jgi:long-chain acyl-CoA synthetase
MAAMPGTDFSDAEDTLPKLLLRNYREFGARVTAIREKDRGIWRSYTWADYLEIVRELYFGLCLLGLQAGDRVGIIGENKPHAYWFELAAQSARGVVVGIFADCTPDEVRYYLQHSGARFVVCHDQEQVDKILRVKDEVPALQKVVYWDPKGLWSYREPLLISMEELRDLGRKCAANRPDTFEQAVESTVGDDTAVFFYSSGTTGLPKAAMVTHRALIGMAAAVHKVDSYSAHEEYLSFLPIAWITEQLFGVSCSLLFALTVNFPEEPETVQENLREVGPRVVFFGPRQWEHLNRIIQAKMLDARLFNRVAYSLALNLAGRVADSRMMGKRPGLLGRALLGMADFVVFRPLRDRLGLARTRVAYTAGAAVSPDVIRYFHTIGVNLKQLYGSSETGVVTLHRDNQVKPETCGPPLPGVEVALSLEGEVLVRTPNLFSGYYKEEKKTAEVLRSGWYHTGDFGSIDNDGHLIVMDRMADLRQLAGGRKFSPQYLETRLRFSPYIKDALVTGRSDKPFVAALINIDLENVGRWAEARRIAYTTFADLSQKEGVIQLVASEIKKVNDTLPEWARIRRFINLPKEFDPDEAELTRTRKLRREFLEDRLADLVEALFGESGELLVESTITYRDGRRGTVQNRILVNSI